MLQKLVDEQEEHQNSRSSGDFIYIYSRNNKKPRSSFFSVVVISTVIMSSVLVLLLLAMTVVPWSSQKILNEDRSRMESSVVQFLIHDELAAEDFKGADDDTDPAVNAQGFVQVDEYYDNEEGVRNDNEASRRAPLSPQEESQLWAVLVAGSNGFYNYRHQVSI